MNTPNHDALMQAIRPITQEAADLLHIVYRGLPEAQQRQIDALIASHTAFPGVLSNGANTLIGMFDAKGSLIQVFIDADTAAQGTEGLSIFGTRVGATQ